MSGALHATADPELVLSSLRRISLRTLETPIPCRLSAVSPRFWQARAEQELSQLAGRLAAGEEPERLLAAALDDTAADICLILQDSSGLWVRTAWASHGLYWHRSSAEQFMLSDEESLLAAQADQLALQPARVLRLLHDDANVSPLGSLFSGIGRIPGGCLARLEASTGSLRITAAPAQLQAASRLDLAKALASALDETAAEIVQQADGGLIYAQISGGLDGLAILSALVARGGRVAAIYGDDGELQDAINQQVIKALRRHWPRAELSYRWVRRGDLPEAGLMAIQEQRCRHLIKGNYLKRNYKLALADQASADLPERPVCAVNGYGIDELYTGAKGDASLSTIHHSSLGLGLARLLSGWRTSRPGLRWMQVRLRLQGSSDPASMATGLAGHLVSAGKAGGSLGLCSEAQVRRGFRTALLADGAELSTLLAPLLRPQPTLAELSVVSKRFIYGLVEQSHLCRFAGHGCAAELAYVLPFEAGRVRRVLERHAPSLAELWQPKSALVSYLRAAGVDYNSITRDLRRKRPSGRKHLRLALNSVRSWLGTVVRPLVNRIRPRRPGDVDNSVNRALRQVRHHHPAPDDLAPLLKELRLIAGADYINALDRAIREGQASEGAFTTKQVYNFAHLIRYVRATRARQKPCW
jgi:hypothetical protein